MLLNVDLQTIFNTEFVGMYMIYLHTKFNVPNSNGSSCITIKLEAKYRFHATQLWYHTLHIRMQSHTQNLTSFKDLLSYKISRPWL
jgi:hypothetical protein